MKVVYISEVIVINGDLGIILPDEIVKAFHLTKDTSFSVQYDREQKELIYRFIQDDNKEVYKTGKKILKKYLPAFQELAKK